MKWGYLIVASPWLAGCCLTPALEVDGGLADAGSDAGPLPGLVDSGPTQTDEYTGRRAALDLLWVIDTGIPADVKAEQAIIANLPAFLAFPFQNHIDLHMSVTSTDLYGGPGSEDGRMLPCPACKVDGPAMRVVDSNTSLDAAVQALTPLLAIGSAARCPGPNPSAFPCEGLLLQAAYEALKPTSLQGYNQAFIRSDAFLAVIAVSGDYSDDQSPERPIFYANYFWSIKGAINADRFSFNLVGLGLDVQHQLRETYLVQLTNGIEADFDHASRPRWEDELNAFWSQYFRPEATMFEYPLSQAPVVDTIRVTDNGREIPASQNGMAQWSYDSKRNAILFAPGSFPSSGDRVLITYAISSKS